MPSIETVELNETKKRIPRTKKPVRTWSLFDGGLGVALAGRAEALLLVVALGGAAGAVDLRRRVSQRERLGVVAQVKLLRRSTEKEE